MRIVENTSTKIFTPFALDSMLRKKKIVCKSCYIFTVTNGLKKAKDLLLFPLHSKQSLQPAQRSVIQRRAP
jgi:hypothetical protein